MAQKPSLTLYPGEYASAADPASAVGHMYFGDGAQGVVASGGYNAHERDEDSGRHTFEPTPPGEYVLGPKKHHTSLGWPASAIPWGAHIRRNPENPKEYDYSANNGKTWHHATGAHGVITKALRLQSPHESLADLKEDARSYLQDDNGHPMKIYRQNDFGNWSWQLFKKEPDGKLKPTDYYIHTTPKDEEIYAKGKTGPIPDTSHGCIHLRPADRDAMMKAGLLAEGATLTVKRYGEKGPLAHDFDRIAKLNPGKDWVSDADPDNFREHAKLPADIARPLELPPSELALHGATADKLKKLAAGVSLDKSLFVAGGAARGGVHDLPPGTQDKSTRRF